MFLIGSFASMTKCMGNITSTKEMQQSLWIETFSNQIVKYKNSTKSPGFGSIC